MNAIAWATIRLRGSWKNYAFSTGGYAALIAILFYYFPHVTVSTSRAMAGLSIILLSLQVAFLIFAGSTAIGNAIRRDLTSGLIASHRLMPVAPSSAVVGYMFGPPLQVIALSLVNLVAGCAASAIAGLDVSNWLTLNALIFILVIFLWTFVTFTALLSKNAFGGLIGIVFASFSSGGFLLALMPPLALLLVPVTSILVGALTRGGTIQLTMATGYAITGQAVFGAIFFRAAMRRYRRDDVPALGTRLSFLLLGAWIVASVVTVMRWELFSFNTRRGEIVSMTTQCVAATVSSMLVALVAISASARASTEWMRSVVTTGFAASRRPVPPPVLSLLAAGLIFALALGLRPQPAVGDVGIVDSSFASLGSARSILFALRVMVVAGIYLLSVSYLLRIFLRAASKPFLLIGIWTAVTWLFPFGFDAARDAATTATNLHAFFARWSPVGELYEIWSHPDRTSIQGVVAQLLLALVPAALFYSTEPKGVRAKPASA